MKPSRKYWLIKTGIRNQYQFKRLSDSARWLYFVMYDFAAEMDVDGRLISPNGSKITAKDLQISINYSANKFKKALKKLEKENLILFENETFEICKYQEHQIKLSSSAERVARFRAKNVTKCNADVTLQNVTLLREDEDEVNKKEKDTKKKGVIFDSFEFKLFEKVVDRINSYLNKHGSDAHKESSAKLTAGGEWLVKRIGRLKKKGIGKFPILTESDIEDFMLSYVDMIGVNKGHVLHKIAGKKSSLNCTTLFRWETSWNDKSDALLNDWKPPSQIKELSENEKTLKQLGYVKPKG